MPRKLILTVGALLVLLLACGVEGQPPVVTPKVFEA